MIDKHKTKQQPDLIDSLLFKGGEIVFPLISLVSLFFFIRFSVPGFQSNGWKLHSDAWSLMAVGSFFFFSLWGYQKRIWTKRFVVIGTVLVLLSFILLPSYYNQTTWRVDHPVYIGYCFAGLALIRFFVNRRAKRYAWPWLLPLILVLGYHLSHSSAWVIMTSTVMLILLTVKELSCRNNLRSLYLLWAVFFYLALTWISYPFSPLKNIQHTEWKEGTLGKSLIVEKEGKYIVVDGASWWKNALDKSFDCWDTCSYKGLVGFMDKEEWGHMTPFMTKNLSAFFSYPLKATDSCVFFAANTGTLKQIKNIRGDIVDSLTARLFFDYLDFFDRPDSASIDGLQARYELLQTEFLVRTTDSTEFRLGRKKPEMVFRDYSRNLSLGLLNALSLDLIENRDYKSAFNLFTWQFLLTLYDTPIFEHITSTFSSRSSATFSDDSTTLLHRELCFSVPVSELSREDTFEPWTQISESCFFWALSYRYDHFKEAKSLVESEIRENLETATVLDMLGPISAQMRKVTDLYYGSRYTRNLFDFVMAQQEFLYTCIQRNYFSDYQSFFLNRYDWISLLFPLCEEFSQGYEYLKSLYEKRFKMNMWELNSFKAFLDTANFKMKELSQLFDEMLSLLQNPQDQR